MLKERKAELIRQKKPIHKVSKEDASYLRGYNDGIDDGYKSALMYVRLKVDKLYGEIDDMIQEMD